MTTTRIGEHTLDDSDEWLVRIALSTYRDTLAKSAVECRRAADQHLANGQPERALDSRLRAAGWERTAKRTLDLEEKFG